MKRPGRLTITLVFIVLCLIWGSTWAVIQIGLEGVPPFSGVSIRFVIEGRFSLASKRTASRRLFSKPATLLSSQYSISLESPDHDEGVETIYHSQNGCQMPPLDNIFKGTTCLLHPASSIRLL